MRRLLEAILNGTYLFFGIGILIATTLLLLHLKKRPRWGLWYALMCVVTLLLSIVCGSGERKIGVLPAACVFVGAMTLLLWICCDLSPIDALYGAICAHAAEHLATIGSGVFRLIYFDSLLFDISNPAHVVSRLVVNLIVFAILDLIIFRNLPENGRFEIKTFYTVLSGIIILVIAVALYRMTTLYYSREHSHVIIPAFLYNMLCCGSFLWFQVAQRKYARSQVAVELERALRRQQDAQYTLKKEHIELIGQKCHDLKHQIAALHTISNDEEREASIREIEQSVMIYDAAVQTGNQVLDVILTEKSLYCAQNNITWTCLADAGNLGFIDTVDLYAMFGNALDNAIEAVRKIEQVDRRLISVTLHSQYGFAFLQVQNYYQQAPTIQADGLPKTTKEDDGYHGFGTKSIQRIAQKYGGTVHFSAEDQIFTLDIMIPIP